MRWKVAKLGQDSILDIPLMEDFEITKNKMEVFVEDELQRATEAREKAEQDEITAREAKRRKQ